MKFVLVVCAVLAGVATAFPYTRVKRSPQSTIVEVIPVEVFEVPPIPSVLAFDFDAARAGKVYSPPAESEDKKEVTKRDEGATEKKQREEVNEEKTELKEEEKQEDEEEVRPEEQIDVRIDEDKEAKTEETPKE